jgi:hypothetical protein
MRFWKNKNSRDDRKELFRLIEKVYRVAQAKMDMGQKQSLLDIVRYVLKVVERIYGLEQENESLFNSIFVGKTGKNSIDLQKQEQALLHREYETLDNVFGVVFKVWEEASKKDEEYIASETLRLVVDSFQIFTAKKGAVSSIIVEYIFQQLRLTIQKELEKSQNHELPRHLNISIFEWYFPIKYSQQFDHSFSEVFEVNLFLNLKILIGKKQKTKFTEFIREVLRIPNFEIQLSYLLGPIGFIFNNNSSERNLSNEVGLMLREIKTIYKVAEFDVWKEKLNRLEKETTNKEQKTESDRLKSLFEQTRKYGIRRYMLNQFRFTLLGIFAYTLSHNKSIWVADALDDLKLYNRIDLESTAQQVLPSYYSDILQIIANFEGLITNSRLAWGYAFKVDHLYDTILILLGKTISLNKLRQRYLRESVGISLFNMYGFKEVVYIRKKLEDLISYYPSFSQKKNILKSLNLSTLQIEEVKTTLINLVSSSKTNIKNHVITSAIDQDKVDSFINNLTSSYSDSSAIRHFLRLHCKNIICFTHDFNKKSIFQRQLVEKTAFISDWNVATIGNGRALGELLAIKENEYLLKKITNSSSYNSDNLLGFLNSIENELENYTLLLINPDFFLENKLPDSSNLLLKSQEQLKQPQKSKQEIKAGYFGRYKEKLDMYRYYSSQSIHKAFVFEKNKLGKFRQFTPLQSSPDLDQFIVTTNDVLFFNLDFFSENKVLLQNTIQSMGNKESDWLKQKGQITLISKVDFKPFDKNKKGLIYQFDIAPANLASKNLY